MAYLLAAGDSRLTIATLAIAAVTLVVGAVAFWSAAIARVQMRRAFLPIVVPARPDGITRDVTFASIDRHVSLANAETYTDEVDGNVLLAFCLRNIGSGVAVVRAIDARAADGSELAPARLPRLRGLMKATRAIYLGPGEAGYLRLRALRHHRGRNATGVVAEMVPARRDFLFDLVYTDLAGKQLTVTRVEFRWMVSLDRYVGSAVQHWRPWPPRARMFTRRVNSALPLGGV